MIKKLARGVIVSLLGWQVRRLNKKHDFQVVGVSGSMGKTSTKFAIATVLEQKYRVRWQAGNYNDLVTVPLIFFGQAEPSLYNPFSWLRVLWANERQVHRPYPYDVVVVEVGTDFVGNVAQFKRYLRCDIGVVTAVTPEHMEFFGSLDQVAKEELSIGLFSQSLVVNTDLCDSQYLDMANPLISFGTQPADYQIESTKFEEGQASFGLKRAGQQWLTAQMTAIAQSELYSATAAAVVADKLALSKQQINRGIKQIQPVSGRMQRLAGIKNSTILDETYNASPDAVMAALDSLYMFKAKHKIAILGNMNELGDYSPQAHKDVGHYCDPNQLDLVVTIGPDANKYLAPAAITQGCLVKTFDDPYQAGQFVHDQLSSGSVILAKGSQNNVYAEEAIKPLLANPKDADKLVRQSSDWLAKKRQNFK